MMPAHRARLRKVLIVNTADRGGGAERVAMSMLDGFEALGTETRLAVGAKHTKDPRVVPFHLSPHVSYLAHAQPVRRAKLSVRRRFEHRLGHEEFEFPYTQYLDRLTGSAPDLVFCHNLHGGFFDLRMLPALTQNLPVVLSLHDSWMFTGHCACPAGCPRWESGCGSCPDLAAPPAVSRDATAWNWRRKQRILAASTLHVHAPSTWALEQARRSVLHPAIEDARVVPHGVDLQIFTPGSRIAARTALGIDPNAHVLVFVASGGRDNPHKDYATLAAAMRRLADGGTDGALELIVAGKAGPEERLGEGVTVRHFGHYQAPEDLAELYRASDLYVHAAHDETFGLTSAEALACGRPVVAAAGGGIREVIDHGRTGLIVRSQDARGLAAAIGELLADPERRAVMGLAAARTARERLDRIHAIAELHDWCTELAERW